MKSGVYKSSIDVFIPTYGISGVVTNLKFENRSEYGSEIYLAPVTTEDLKDSEICIKKTGKKTEPIRIDSFMPSSSNSMKYIGIEFVNNRECEKWQITFTKLRQETLWIQKRKASETDYIPVRYAKCTFDATSRNCYRNVYYNFDTFSIEEPDSEVFDIANNIIDADCLILPTFNSMNSFLTDYTHNINMKFQHFKKKFNKTYSNNDEHQFRRKVFEDNVKFINDKNRQNLGYKLKVNHFADLTYDEIQSRIGKLIHPLETNSGGSRFPYTKEQINKFMKRAPKEYDWRIHGAVSPVEDQSDCGSCWSFSAAGAVEGAYFRKNKKLIRLSEQALIDCSWGYNNLGCVGGLAENAFRFIVQYGIPTDDEYGNYLANDGLCHINNIPFKNKIYITNYIEVNKNVKALKFALLNHGPVSVHLNFGPKELSYYSSGVYYNPNCNNTMRDLNHAVLLVGYGKLNDEDYWLIKNSWSSYWGLDGYMLLSQKNNNCGILTRPPVYVEIDN